MDRLEILILNICHVNPSNQNPFATTFKQIYCIEKKRNILVKNNMPCKDKGTPQWNS